MTSAGRSDPVSLPSMRTDPPPGSIAFAVSAMVMTDGLLLSRSLFYATYITFPVTGRKIMM